MKKITDRDKRVLALARRYMDATIDAATIEYAKMVIDPDAVDIPALEQRVAEISKRAVWPKHELHKTVETVSSARGNFKW